MKVLFGAYAVGFFGVVYGELNPSFGNHRRLNADGFLQVGQNLYGTPASDFSSEVDFGEAVMLNKDGGNRLVIGAPHHDFGPTGELREEAGAVFVYDYDGSNWTQTLSFHGDPGENMGDRFGLSADGSRLALRRYVPSAADVVEVLDISTSTPVQLGSPLSCGAEGSTVALSSDGNRVAVSCEFFNGNRGRVDVFDFDGASWNLIGSFESSVALALFGWCVDFDSTGTRLAISAPNYSDEFPRIGLVRLFDYNGSEWNQVGVDLVGTDTNQQFGFSMGLSGDGESLAVGSPVSDGTGDQRGTVTVYALEGNTTTPVGDIIEGEFDQDRFGRSTAMSADGSRVVSSSYLHDGQRGQVRLFEWNGTSWQQVGGDIEGEEESDWYGYGLASVSITADGTRIAGGAVHREDEFGTPTGHVQVFDEEIITESPSQAPSGITPTGAPSTSPTMDMTTPVPTSVLGKFDWDLTRVGDAVAVFNDDSQGSEITLEYFVHTRPFTVAIFQPDCETPVPSSVIQPNGTTTPVTPTHSNLTVFLDVMEDAVVDSEIWESTGVGEGVMGMCVRVDLILEDGTSVNFHEQILFVTVGLTQGFRIENIDLDRFAPTNETQTATVDYGILACQCNETFTCGNEVLKQGSDVFICVFTNATNVEIVSIESLDFIQTSLTSSPITNGIENILTSVTVNYTRAIIRTQLISAFFVDSFPADLIVEGVVAIGFTNETPAFPNRRLVSSAPIARRLEDTKQESGFDLQIKLESVSDTSAASAVSVVLAAAFVAFSGLFNCL